MPKRTSNEEYEKFCLEMFRSRAIDHLYRRLYYGEISQQQYDILEYEIEHRFYPKWMYIKGYKYSPPKINKPIQLTLDFTFD